jgi:hypothetical protein
MSPSFVQFFTRVYQFSCRDPNYKDCLLSKLEKWILRKVGLKLHERRSMREQLRLCVQSILIGTRGAHHKLTR